MDPAGASSQAANDAATPPPFTWMLRFLGGLDPVYRGRYSVRWSVFSGAAAH